MEPSEAQEACFEAGIKLGSLYHQFAGTPVSPETAPALARAMETAIENQPYCTEASVEILEDELEDELVRGYTEMTGQFLAVELTVDCGGSTVEASMTMVDGYPEMRIDSVE